MAAALLIPGCGPTNGHAARATEGFPDAAQRYATAKRLPLDRLVDTRAAYREAERHLRGMPAHSTALGRRLDAMERTSREIRGQWKPLGPGNVGGRMRTIVIDPGDPDRMLVGGVSGGVWRTENAGGSWEPVGDDLQNVAVNSMVMSPADPRTVYIGTGEGYFREDVRGTGLPLRGGGIFRSDDRGDSWHRLPGTDTRDFWFVNDLAVSTADATRVYAATRTGVWRSRDGGEQWERILAANVQGGCLDLALRTDRGPDTLFASCGTFERATVYRNENAQAGVDWESVLSEPDMGRTSLAIAPSNQDVVYALAANNAPGIYEQGLLAVFRSTDGGGPGSWEARIRNDDVDRHHTLLLSNPVISVNSICGFGTDSYLGMGWYANVIAVDPVDPDIVWAAGVDWFRSDDGGNTWGPASYWWARGSCRDCDPPGWAHADQHAIVFHPDYDGTANQTLFVGNDGGLFRTDSARDLVDTGRAGLCDPVNTNVDWVPLNNGLEVTQFYQGQAFPNGRSYLGGTQDNGTILRSRRSGANGWVPVFGGDGGYVAIDPVDTDVLYAEFQWSQFQKSVDGGLTFFPIREGLPTPRTDDYADRSTFLFVTPLVMDPGDRHTLWTGGRSVYRTRTGGNFWEAASKTLRRRSRVSAVAVSELDRDRVAAGTDRGFIFVTDRGTTADASTRWPAKRPRAAWVTSVAFDPTDPEVLYATYGGFGGNHVYRSTNGGRRWRSLDGRGSDALPDIPVHTIVVDPDDPNRLFIGTDLGVFVSTDGGDSWEQEIAGFGNIVTEWLQFQKRGKRRFLYAFTHGRSAWVTAVKPSS